MVSSVFSSENSPFSFQDHNRIPQICLQWPDFVKVKCEFIQSHNSNNIDSHSPFCSCDKGMEQILLSLISCSNFLSIQVALSQMKCSKHEIFFEMLIFCLLESFNWILTCFICCWSRWMTWELLVFSRFRTNTKTFKPLVYCLSIRSSISITHFMGFCSCLAHFKTKLHVRSLFDFTALCVLQQRCEMYIHYTLINYLNDEQSELKLVRWTYRDGGNTTHTH
jgi:hypothetical protein